MGNTVILINPNSTEAMTVSAVHAAKKEASDLHFEGWTSIDGPKSIQGQRDGEVATKPLLELVNKANDQQPCAIVIACFDDTALELARNRSSCPVVGIGEASFIESSLYEGKTAVITTVHSAVPVIKQNIEASGFNKHIAAVIAADVEVLDLDKKPSASALKFTKASECLDLSVKNVILGCSGAVKIKRQFENSTNFRVFDGVSSAARLCRLFV